MTAKARLGLDELELGSWRANGENTIWLLVTIVAVVLPHMSRLPIWVSGVFLGLVVYRWLVVKRGFATPGRWFMVTLAVFAIVAVLIQYRSVLGRDSGVAMLTLLAGLKLLETQVARDAYVTLLLAYFLAVTNFLYSQDVATGAYMLVVMLVTTASLVSLQHPLSEVDARRRLRIAGVHLAQALPLMLVAYLLFPRLSGPLWGLPKDAHAGVTGLSESMRTGQISSLSRSNAVAFRVRFAGERPESSEMYWRGPVLDKTDGLNWTRAEEKGRMHWPHEAVRNRARPVSYTVTLEPTQQDWLFALELPGKIPDRATFTTRGELKAKRKIRERMQYEATSYLSFDYPALRRENLLRAAQLPAGYHPRARRLAAEWAAKGRSPDEIVALALQYFREQPFTYTLQPPLLAGDPIDEFLFLTRRGFCEHFASAFTVLMRAAGIPTRVVTGYQGGERNDVGDYWVVRQRDAHAWSEVWLGKRGWVRVDPTAAVAPERVELGVDLALPDSGFDSVFGIASSDTLTRWWRQMRFSWDNLNNTWNQWVLGYGATRQTAFLANLGVDVRSWRDVGTTFLIVMFCTFAAVAAVLLLRRPGVDPVRKAYTRFCARLASRGVDRLPAEGPRDFAVRAARALPQHADEIEAICAAYENLRYGDAEPALAGQFSRAVKAFRP